MVNITKKNLSSNLIFSFKFSALIISLQAQTASQDGEIVFKTKPVSTEGCTYEFIREELNITLQEPHNEDFHLHHISYLYYSVLGTIITVLIAFIVSLFVGLRDPAEVDSKLLAPCVRNYFKSNPQYEMTVQKVSVTHEFNDQNNQIKAVH